MNVIKEIKPLLQPHVVVISTRDLSKKYESDLAKYSILLSGDKSIENTFSLRDIKINL